MTKQNQLCRRSPKCGILIDNIDLRELALFLVGFKRNPTNRRRYFVATFFYKLNIYFFFLLLMLNKENFPPEHHLFAKKIHTLYKC